MLRRNGCGQYRIGKEFHIGVKLGEGGYGQVYHVDDPTSNTHFAVKVRILREYDLVLKLPCSSTEVGKSFSSIIHL